ncbi:Y-family DNA polymerase [Candidatus Enterococcus courvalinii]|uniref:Y-family DNA polymerase n=1 Tax=Candidatus Enterococcus courvalinii TaxID=2815329 RepID=A0ABS3HY58_9ENTE|nr:Y-family DNA polymerase [Enterococcus sp. MSG2901]MBO0481398.1 Y-family DNA polymerase [Enterococcus sp. MSG2901]
MLDYSNEPVNDYFMIDMKSFYASVECIERGLNPLTTELVVMSQADNTGSGLILASSPMAKQQYGISNVSRPRDLPSPFPDSLIIAAPRMNLYIKRNMEVNDIFRKYVADEDLLIYSIDESILKVTSSMKLFTTEGKSRSDQRKQLARKIQRHVYREMGLIATVGIGDNPLLAKLALDNEAKRNEGFIAEWTYQDVPNKVWRIREMTDFWGIGSRTKKRLNQMGIMSIEGLANWKPYSLKNKFGVMGLQLYFHANGIDRTDIAVVPPQTKEKSYGNSQVLPRDYTRKEEIEIVVKEMAEQVAIRIRKQGCKTSCIHVGIGTSILEEKEGFSRQMKIPLTNNTKELQMYCMYLFHKFYDGQEVRHVSIAYSKLVYTDSMQLDLFSDPEKQMREENLDRIIDKIRGKYGFSSIVHASSYLEGARSIDRSHLVGGHAGGNGGIDHV